MLGLIVRRLLALIPMLLIVSFVVFGLIALVPGDAATTIAGGVEAQPEAIERVRQELNLDDPFFVRYGNWLWDSVQLDLGNSLYSDQPVRSELADRIPVTLGLTALVFAIAISVAFVAGILGGLKPGSILDRALLAGSSATMSMPSFWVALLLVSIFAVRLGWLPPFGYVPFGDSATEWFKSMILPAVALALAPAAILSRQLRGGLADTMGSAFIRTAWAKGGTTSKVVVGHALKNSAGPAVTVLGLQIGVVLGGSVVVERIFNIPGIGSYLLNAANSQDVPAVQGVAMLFVIIQVVVSLLVDVAYGFLNPKVRDT